MNFASLSMGASGSLGSAFFLGVSPVLGKLAITLGLSPLAVVALRTRLIAVRSWLRWVRLWLVCARVWRMRFLADLILGTTTSA